MGKERKGEFSSVKPVRSPGILPNSLSDSWRFMFPVRDKHLCFTVKQPLLLLLQGSVCKIQLQSTLKDQDLEKHVENSEGETEGHTW